MSKHLGWIVAAGVVLLALTQGRQTAGPMQPTVVAGVAYTQANFNEHRIYRFWSDGQVDTVWASIGNNCTPSSSCGPTVIIPGTCPGDITHDGAVATADLLGVLETWGPCPEGVTQ